MKKFLTFILVLFAVSSISLAKVQVGIGVKGGACFGKWNNYFLKHNLSTVGGTHNSQIGATGGLQGRVWFNKFIGLNLAAEFNMDGNIGKFQNNTKIFTRNTRLNQLTLAVNATPGWGNERVRIFGVVGGYFGYILSGKEKATLKTNTENTLLYDGKADFDSLYNRIDAGIRLGLGAQIYVSKNLKHSITFELTYDFGMLKTFKNQPLPYNDKYKIQNSKTLLSVGYMFNLGKSQSEEAPASRKTKKK